MDYDAESLMDLVDIIITLLTSTGCGFLEIIIVEHCSRPGGSEDSARTGKPNLSIL